MAKPPGYEADQVAARVLGYDEAKKSIVPLSKSFFPFLSNAKTGGIRTLQMSVAMTTKEIAIAAKGEVNLQGKPELGANSPREVNFYTVISHPDPKDDPTTPAGAPPAGAIISKVVETGGDNEATDTIAAKWTGQEFTVSVANEPIPGAAIGQIHRRTFRQSRAGLRGPQPSLHKRLGHSVIPLPDRRATIMSGNDSRDNAAIAST